MMLCTDLSAINPIKCVDLPIRIQARFFCMCAALMKSAREELQRRELNAQNFQSLESHLAKMHLETDSMRSKVLELRVKTAILGNRFVRLDNPILMAKTKDLAAKLADVMNAT